jgi:hypothetical protein
MARKSTTMVRYNDKLIGVFDHKGDAISFIYRTAEAEMGKIVERTTERTSEGIHSGTTLLLYNTNHRVMKFWYGD